MDTADLKEKLLGVARGELELQTRNIKPHYTGSWRCGEQVSNANWLWEMVEKDYLVAFDGRQGRLEYDGWATEFKFNELRGSNWNLAQI